MKYYTALILIMALVILMSGCITIAQTIPNEGRWYCEEWGVTVDFDKKTCVASVKSTEIICAFYNNRGSKFVSIINQDLKSEDFYLGETMFEGECIYYDENVMVIKENKTEKICNFYRVDLPYD